jgi:deazaflavin-dependent oxidoreductase (nitroreductase family)
MDRTELEQHNRRITDEFRQGGGVVGGMYTGMSLLLLHTVGARTGQRRVNPLVCQRLDGGSYAVFAANGGAPVAPDWYHNLLDRPQVEIEVGTAQIPVTARVATGEERATIWDRQTELVPHFAELAGTAGRQIPVVVLDSRTT